MEMTEIEYNLENAKVKQKKNLKLQIKTEFHDELEQQVSFH